MAPPMELIPENALPPLYTGEQGDPQVAVKLFTPWSKWTWYLTEYDPETRLAFGLVDGHEAELGYVSIEELEGIVGPFGLTVERDLYWNPRPLSMVRAQVSARRGGF